MTIPFANPFANPFAPEQFDYIDYAYDPNAVPVVQLRDDESNVVARLRKRLNQTLQINILKGRYYDGKQNTYHLKLSIPAQLGRSVEVVNGWAGKVVDSVEERIDFRGWASTGDILGLDEVYKDNFLGVEASRAQLDSLIYGVSFLAVGTGVESNNEPDILVTAESPLRATMLWDYRARQAEAGMIRTYDERGRMIMETIYLRNETITLERNDDGSTWEVTARDPHNKGRVPMVRLLNRDRASDMTGRSEITPPIRYYVDAAVRTLLGMEVNREFYTTPQTYALNVRPEKFGVTPNMTDEQKKRLGWKIIMGHVNILPPNEAGEAPADIKQLTPAPPTPYIEQVKCYAQLVSSDSGVPANYFGFTTDIAPSSDAIVAADYPLIRKAERRLGSSAIAMLDLAGLITLWRDGKIDRDKLRQLSCNYANPATPTAAAQADATQKMVASEVFTPDGKVTYDGLNLTPAQQDQLKIDKEEYHARKLAEAVAIQAATPAPAAPGAPGGTNHDGSKLGGAKNPKAVQRGTVAGIKAGQ